MRLNNPTVVIPYFTTGEQGETLRTHSAFRFNGQVDYRRVRRMIRKSLKGIGIHAQKFYIDHYIRFWIRHTDST